MYYAKVQVFSWRRPFQTKLLFFQTIESEKRTFATKTGSAKPAFLHALFVENEKQNNRKDYGTIPIKVQGHMQKFSSFRGKKMGPRKSLKIFMQVPLQLIQTKVMIKLLHQCEIISDDT